MVKIPSPVQNYVMLWLLSLGSSIVLIVVSAFVYLIEGADAKGSISQYFILMFNATATSFILLTMIPLGAMIILFIVIWNAIAPFAAPLLAGAVNFFAQIAVGLANMVFINITYTEITISPETVDITESVGAVIDFLDALRKFLMGAATEGTFGSGRWNY